MSAGPPGDPDRREDTDEPPPLLGAWRNLYWLVVAALVLEIVFLGCLARIS